MAAVCDGGRMERIREMRKKLSEAADGRKPRTGDTRLLREAGLRLFRGRQGEALEGPGVFPSSGKAGIYSRTKKAPHSSVVLFGVNANLRRSIKDYGPATG